MYLGSPPRLFSNLNPSFDSFNPTLNLTFKLKTPCIPTSKLFLQHIPASAKMLQTTLISVISLLPLISAVSVPYTNVSITSSDIPRYYLLTEPPNFDPSSPTPVIFSFHGATRTAEEQYDLSLLSDPYFNDYAITVYPNGLQVPHPILHTTLYIPANTPQKLWQGAPDSTANDTQFTLDVLSDLKSKYSLDESRIYATGKSQGGGFVGVLACDPVLSNKFAAFAPVSGAFYIKNDTKCAPRTIAIPCSPGRAKIPIIEFHGGEDDTIKYAGAGRNHQCVPSIVHWVREWAKRDGLEQPKNVSSVVSEDTTLYQFETEDGKELGLVSHVFDAVIGHDWPATVSLL